MTMKVFQVSQLYFKCNVKRQIARMYSMKGNSIPSGFLNALTCSLHYFRFSLPSLQFNLTNVLVSTDGHIGSMRLFDA